MTKFIKYPSTPSPKEFVKSAKRKNLKTVDLVGTTKIHGTNGAVVVSKSGESWCQSRNRVLDIGSDNHGFAAWCESRDIFDPSVLFFCMENYDADYIVAYGEFCGGNIQDSVGMTGAEKAFVVFSVVAVKETGDEFIFTDLQKVCVDPVEYSADSRVFDVRDFGLMCETINFNVADEVNALMKYVDQIENKCPVAAVLNEGSECTVGEGVVWKAYSGGEYVGFFKMKGEKHTRTGKRTKSLEDRFSEAARSEFGEFALRLANEDRLMQGIEYLKEMQKDTDDPRNIGEYIKWVQQDILKEHKDDIAEFIARDEKYEWKPISTHISKISREFYLAQ